MYSRAINPWLDVARVFSMMQLLQGEWPGRGLGLATDVAPKVNVWRKDDVVVVTAELPGAKPDSLAVTVNQDQVTLEGEVPGRERGAEESYYHGERFTGRFQRTLTLPFRVDAEKTEATYRNGVLQVRLTAVAADQPRAVTVKVQ